MTETSFVIGMEKYGISNILNKRQEDNCVYLISQGTDGSVDVKRKKMNRKRIGMIIGVLLVTMLFFGFYAAFGGSLMLNEVGTATSYFESGSSISSSSAYVYYYYAFWSPSHGNAIQSMINAMYATGMGWIITGIADLVNASVGHQALVGSTAVAWVAGFLVGLYTGASALVAASDAAAEAGVSITLGAAVLSTLAGLGAAYLGALGAA